MRLLLTFFAIAFSLHVLAQTSYTLSGHIQDANSGEQLIGATIYGEETRLGVASNIYGFYSLTLPEGKHTVVVTYIGYTAQKFEIYLSKNLSMDINLIAGTELQEAIVTGDAFNKIEDQVQMSKVEIPIDQIKRLPAIGGEVDLLRVLQLMPGVQSGGEGTSGLYVRGGSPDQNLMLLDGVPLYNVNHLFGFFSVFNADAVRNMSLTKGGFPARFGGRLSSILEIHMKDGNMKEYHGDATVSIIAAKATIEGPIVRDHASFMLSYRRTYIDLLLGPMIRGLSKDEGNDVIADPTYFFHDFNGKMNWKIGKKDRLYFSAFSGKDDFGIDIDESFGGTSTNASMGLDWKNEIQALRWNHEWGPKMFSNFSLTHSKYNFNSGFDIAFFEGDQESTQFSALYNSYINDFAAKLDFDYSHNSRHLIRYGANHIWHRFVPGATAVEFDFGGFNPIDTVFGPGEVKSRETYVYIEDEMEVTEGMKINAGLHASTLSVQDTSYYSLQPRLAFSYKLPGDVAFKASYAEMAQFVNLLTNEGLSMPTDLWVPSTANIRPQESWQIAAGFAKTINDIEISLEGYYKSMDGLLSYKEGASFLFDIGTDWESKVTQGIGESYGYEILIQKKHGRSTGWLGYTNSWSNRTFEEINSGREYPFTYDRRHDISFVYNFDLNDMWSSSFVWVYGTGRALTLSETTFSTYVPDAQGVDTFVATIPSEKNSYRMSPYHRADISFTKETDYDNGATKFFIISVYNLYNNLNPFFAEIDYDDNDVPHIREYGIFPIIPSVAWRFKF